MKPLASVKDEVMKSFNEKFVPELKNIDKLQKNIDSLQKNVENQRLEINKSISKITNSHLEMAQ
jgi:hypothetical protein